MNENNGNVLRGICNLIMIIISIVLFVNACSTKQDIKSIVTHEQFSQMEYRTGE